MGFEVYGYVVTNNVIWKIAPNRSLQKLVAEPHHSSKSKPKTERPHYTLNFVDPSVIFSPEAKKNKESHLFLDYKYCIACLLVCGKRFVWFWLRPYIALIIMASKGTQENVKTNDETTGISIIATNEGGVLSSLRELDELRANATNVQRLEGSNLDFWIDGTTGQEIVLAHFTGLVPFTAGGSFKPFHIGFEDTASIALAAHHLNTGDGSIIPQVAGLSETCKIRFTVEMADSAFDGGTSLRLINELTGRDLQEPKPRPTAFLGPYRSAVCMSTSIINGALGYPQVSPGAAAPELDDKTQYPLFGRTVPSDEGRNLPVVLYLAQVLQLQHLAVIYVNDAYGNAFIEYLRRVADIHAPQLDIQAFSISFKDRSVPGAIESVKATGFRFIFCAFLQVDAFDEVVIEGYNQGIAGTGVHNWLFNAAFSGVLPGRKFEKNSPLHLAYRYVPYLSLLYIRLLVLIRWTNLH